MKMYVKCRKLDLAKEVFQQMSHRHVVVWTIMIAAYAESGDFSNSFQAFCRMQLEGVLPNSFTLVAVFQACGDAEDDQVRLLCDQLVEGGFMDSTSCWNVIVATAVIGIFGRCGSVEKALRVFGRIPADERDAVAWNAIVTVCVDRGKAALGLEFFRKMRLEGVGSTRITFIKALAAATEIGSLEAGRMLHAEASERSLDSDVMVGTALASMYNRFGRIDEAVDALNRIEQQGRDLVCWNRIISALVQSSRGVEALSYFRRMNFEGIKPDRGTLATLLSGMIFPESEVELILSWISQAGLSCDAIVKNAVLNMLAKRHRLREARAAFDWIQNPDLVSWNTMISAYVAEGCGDEAIKLFHRMHQDGLRPDAVTLTSIFGAFSELRDLEEACQLTLATMELEQYQEKPLQVFHSLLLADHARRGLPKQSLEIFRCLQLQGVKLDNAALIPVITSCAACSALKEGRSIHAELQTKSGTTVLEDCRLKNALIDMYGKCGKLNDAYATFAGIKQPNIISWTAIVAAYAQNGHSEEASYLFRLMKLCGFPPDSVTFTSILSMCSHAGLLEEGCSSFGSMSSDFLLRPGSEHYSCVIDLLGRAGWLEEAEALIHRMPCEPTVFIWTALLSACRSHGDVERGQRIADSVVGLDPGCSTGYIGLTNIIST